MNFSRLPLLNFGTIALGLVMMFALTSCGDDDDDLASMSFDYALHTGQTVPSAAYSGTHPTDFSATLKLDEMDNGNTMVTVTLDNTVDGETYNIHSHDAADAATTPNGTPYNETPNMSVFAQSVAGDGGTVSVSQEATMSFVDLTTTYEAFFVVHDPTQDLSTVDISTYLVVGSFAR